MAGNTFGTVFKLTTYGESHGEAIGGMIDGCPAGLELDFEQIQYQLDRRKPGQSNITSPRKESDEVHFVSGVFEGKTTGTPIGFYIKNEDSRSKDYGQIKDTYRPSHADYTYDQKYGFRDYRGGGRSSARETACRVVGGAIAAQLLAKLGVEVYSFVNQVEDIVIPFEYNVNPKRIDKSVVRCPHPDIAREMEARIQEVRREGDSLGGIIRCIVKGVPAGWGEPVFDKLHADLGKAMLSINAVKGFEIGSGFHSAIMKGSEHNDVFVNSESGVSTETNFSGGIQGGISNGQTIDFKVAFKPVATIMQKQQTINTEGELVTLMPKGRHDPCVVPRAVPIVDAMAALVLADHYLRSRTNRI